MKKILLIAGGGTLGTYATEELLNLGHKVDVICLEDKISNNADLKYYKENATYEYLEKLFEKENYDGIINFIHYVDVEEYKRVYRLLIRNTEHLIFLSSYRVYADLEHPIKETSPLLLDAIDDKLFEAEENYAVPKTKCERFLRTECKGENWTIVRPVISFSKNRFDLFVHNLTKTGQYVIECVQSGTPVVLPECAKEIVAGLDWAGNTGKLIARLLFKKEAFGEAYTVSSAENLMWSEVADIYTELIGLAVEYQPTEEYVKDRYPLEKHWGFWYDRIYSRSIDNRKILEATGVKKEELLSIKEGLKIELDKFGFKYNDI